MIKVAICMYGQWRSGDICLPYLKKFFSNTAGAEVDFFCSVKKYNSPANRPDLNAKHFYTDSKIIEIKEKLISTLNVKKIKIYSDPDYLYGGFLRYTGIIDAVMLKRTYEVENNIEYDLVFLCRYDTLVRPLEYFKELISTLTKVENLKIFRRFNHNEYCVKDIIFSNEMEYYSHNFNTVAENSPEFNVFSSIFLGKKTYTDLLLFGTNSAIDIMCDVFLDIITFSDIVELEKNKDIDLHCAISRAYKNTPLQICNYPAINTSTSGVYVGWKDADKIGVNLQGYAYPATVQVRESFVLQEGDNIFQASTINKIMQHKISQD